MIKFQKTKTVLKAIAEADNEAVSSNSLLRCPFCGFDEPEVCDAGFNHVAVRCDFPQCEAQGKRSKDFMVAVNSWNQRNPND